jgi:hypothetical protein
MPRQIILDVSPEGTPTITTKGYQGKGCKDASRFLEEALGTKATERLTPEYHQPEKNDNHNRQGH